MLCRNTFIFRELIFWGYVLDIDVTRNGNNLKLNVKSEDISLQNIRIPQDTHSFLLVLGQNNLTTGFQNTTGQEHMIF